jgi:hypothetical protein
MIVKYLNI